MGTAFFSIGLAAAGTAFAAPAQSYGPGVTWSVEQLDAAKEHDQLIVVVGEGADSQRAEVSFYQKNEDGSWTEEFTVDGFVGRNGSSGEKREGDEKTPTGIYAFTLASV